MEEKKKKLTYTTLQNLRYALSKWWGWDSRGLVQAFSRIPCVVLIPLMGILLPREVINCVTEGAAYGRLAVTLVIFTALLCALHMYDKYIAQGKLFAIGLKNRMNYMYLWAEKIFTTDFPNIESSGGQRKKEKALQFLYQSSAGGEAVVDCVVGICGDALGLIIYAGIVSSIHPAVLPALVLMSALIYIAGRIIKKLELGIRDESADLERKLNYLFAAPTDFAAGKDLRIYKISRWFGGLFSIYFPAMIKLCARNELWWFADDVLQGILNLLRDGACYLLLIRMVLEGSITPGDFTMYFGAVAGVSQWLNDITKQVEKINRFSVQCCEFRDFLEMPDGFVNDGKECLDTEGNRAVDITFEHVFFRYLDAEADTLRDLSFHIRAGEKLALVGLNGAGKTTCVKLMCGLYHPTGGRILINGKDMSKLSRDEYYRLFSAVFQEANFMPFTIAQNVSGAMEDMDRERVKSCLELAGLWDRVQKLPYGMDSLLNRELNEDGVELSGGERQKLLLAKALYKKAFVVILDEPTAALDPIAENELYQSYGELTEGRTSLYISHRLSSTRFCDRILFLENGRITETGNHEALMAAKGAYAHMYEVQSHYYKKKAEGRPAV